MLGTPVHDWLIFFAVVVGGIAVDVLVLGRTTERITWKQALGEIAFWIAVALAFDTWMYFSRGLQPALEFLTGYVVEESLSVDNILLFLLAFQAFHVPPRSEHKILYSGLAGAFVFRAIFVFAGVALLNRFRFVLYVFGAFLVFTGVKMLFPGEHVPQPQHNWFVRLATKFLPVADGDGDGRFWIKGSGRWLATRLFIALIAVEVMDILFAVDSIPAVLAITRNAFIVYSSNIFAILGLRAMYFGLAGILPRFRFLHQGLAAILMFVGGEMLVSAYFTIPTLVALLAIAAILVITAMLSGIFPAPLTAGRSGP